MAENIGEGAAFIGTGTLMGASVSATVGGMGLVGGFGGVGIGMTPVAAAGGVVGAAAFGAFQAIGEGDAAAFGAIGIGAVGGIGVYSAVGGMGLSFGGTAVGIGMGTMAATGGVIGLAAYGIAKLIDKAGSGETPAQAFARMEEKILWQDAYNEALLELELMSLDSKLSDRIWQQKFAALEVEEELNKLKEQVRKENKSYFNFTAANFQKTTFRPFCPNRKIVSVKVQQSQIWKCVLVLEGHLGSVNSLAISADNEIIASGSGDRTVSLWNLKTGKRIYTFFCHGKEVYAVAISPDGQMLVSGDFDQKITRWNITKKELLGTCFYLNSPHSHTGFVYSVAFTPDGKNIVSASADKTIRIWGRFTGTVKRTLNGHSEAVMCIAITPDGKFLVSGSLDKTMIIWNLETGKIIRVLKGHSGWVTSVVISPDGKIIVSSSTDGTIKLWHLETGELISTLYEESSKIFSVAISPDGKTIASGNMNKVHIWDRQSGKLMQTISARYPVAFSPDGKTLVTGGNSNKIKIWHQYFGTNETTSDSLLTGEWWEVLGVDKNADATLVKRAYRNLARQYHPDLNPSKTAKINMQAIVEAYKNFRRK